MNIEEKATPKTLFVLVHGTFAHDAPWIQEESDFSKRLKSIFGNDITLLNFSWTGKNLHEERYVESEKLRLRLTEIKAAHPGHRKIIIAHSHGGNLAVYALRDKEIQADYELITLGTPFLNYRARDFVNSMEVHKFLLTAFIGLFSTVFISMMGMLLLGGLLQFFISDSKIVDNILMLSFFGVIAVTLFTVFPMIFKRFEKFQNELPDFVKKADAQYASGYLKNYRVLCLVNRADEVRLWFGFSNYILRNMFNLYEWSFNFLKKLALYGGAILLIYIIVMAFLDGIIEADLKESMLTQAVVVIFGAPVLAFLTFPYFTFFLAFSYLLLKSNPVAYGWENIKYMMFLDFKPSIQPENASRSRVVTLPTLTGPALSLKHSIYNNQNIFPIIEKWVKNTSE